MESRDAAPAALLERTIEPLERAVRVAAPRVDERGAGETDRLPLVALEDGERRTRLSHEQMGFPQLAERVDVLRRDLERLARGVSSELRPAAAVVICREEVPSPRVEGIDLDDLARERDGFGE